jgi:hypothetical protein
MRACDYCLTNPATCVFAGVHACDLCCAHTQTNHFNCKPFFQSDHETETTMSEPENPEPEFFFTEPEPPPTIVEGVADIQIRVTVGGVEVHGKDAVKVFCAVIAAQLESLWNSRSYTMPNVELTNAQRAAEPTVK